MTKLQGDAAPSGWRRFWWRGGFWRALVMVLAYLGLYLGAGRLIGLVFGGADRPGGLLGSPSNVFFELTAAILVGIALLVVFAWSLGWLRGIFARQPRAGRWWMWILPLAILVFNVLRFAAADYAVFSAATVVMVLFTGLCVGAAEELLTRGLAVSLLRRAGHRELAVAVLSSLLFAASHAVNVFSGQAVPVVVLTVIYAFFFGIGMYLTLRITRSLVWPILLHATTDPSGIFLAGGVDTSSGAAPGALAIAAEQANYAVVLVGLIVMWFIRGRIGADTAGQPTTSAIPADTPAAATTSAVTPDGKPGTEGETSNS